MAKCLVVDDVEVTRFTTTKILEEMGIKCETAETPDEASKKLNQGGYDVIFLDWHIGANSGIDLLKKIRSQHGQSMKVVMFSGVEGADKAGEAADAGANDFITKPTTPEKVQTALRDLGIRA